MNRLKFGAVGLMGLAALVVLDYLAVSNLARIADARTRIGLFGALPMLNVLGLLLVLLGERLRLKGEIGLSSALFLLVGGIAAILVGVIASDAPHILHLYIENTAGLWIRQGQSIADIYLFGIDRIDPLQALLVCATITPLILVPALIASRSAPGFGLKLHSPQGSEQQTPMRFRISLLSLMVVIAVVAIDLAILILRQRAINSALLGAIPMADVLVVLLAINLVRLRSPGETPLSSLLFLLGGGIALIVLIYLVQLSPYLVYGYLRNTAGRLDGGYRVLGVLMHGLAISLPILVPALAVSWASRGDRLRLSAPDAGPSQAESFD